MRYPQQMIWILEPEFVLQVGAVMLGAAIAVVEHLVKYR